MMFYFTGAEKYSCRARKIISLTMIVVLSFTLVACGRTQQSETKRSSSSSASETTQNEGSSSKDSATAKTDKKDGKILIAYFSWSTSGNTEKMATYIQEQTGEIS